MKFFKVGLLLCLAESLAIDSKSQNLDFKKDVVKSIDDLNITLSFDDRNAVAKELIRIDAHGQSDEELVHQSGRNRIKIKHSQNKSELVALFDNSVSASVPFNQGEVVTPIDNEGNLVAASYVDGAGHGFSFLTPQLTEVASYTPYETGFKEAKIGYSDKLVCFYAVYEQQPKTYKLGLTDHSGKLLGEREFDRGNYGASDLKILGNQVLLLFNDYSSAESKILAFDGSLNLLWERKFSTRISGYSITVDETSKSILVITQPTVYCINIDGTTRWELSSNEFYGSSVPKAFTSAYLMNGIYMVIVVSEYSDGSKFHPNKLFVVSLEKGDTKFERELGASELQPKVFGGKEGFVLAVDNQIFSYYAKTK